VTDLGRMLREALLGLWRSRGSTLLTVLTIGISVYLLGGFILMSEHLARLAEAWKRESMVQIFIAEGNRDEQRRALEAELSADPGVVRWRFRSREEALETFARVFGSLSDLPRALGSNPFPSSYEVELRESDRGRASVAARLERWRAFPGVEDVQADLDWIESLRRLLRGLQATGIAVGLILAACALFTVVNVISLAAHLRRDEIAIMRLVGATAAWISGPYWIEGALQGLLGGAVGLAFLRLSVAGVAWARSHGPTFLSFIDSPSPLSAGSALGLLVASALMGFAGSAFAVRRFLRAAA
jgi:cell division transport system permease protein